MKTVFAVSRGEYSDYQVMCVCEDRATAQRLVDAYNGSEVGSYEKADIEEKTLYESSDKPELYTTWSTWTQLHRDLHVSETRCHSDHRWNFDGGVKPPVRPDVVYHPEPLRGGGFLIVTGQEERAVAKVTGERIAAFKARSWVPQREQGPPAE